MILFNTVLNDFIKLSLLKIVKIAENHLSLLCKTIKTHKNLNFFLQFIHETGKLQLLQINHIIPSY